MTAGSPAHILGSELVAIRKNQAGRHLAARLIFNHPCSIEWPLYSLCPICVTTDQKPHNKKARRSIRNRLAQLHPQEERGVFNGRDYTRITQAFPRDSAWFFTATREVFQDSGDAVDIPK